MVLFNLLIASVAALIGNKYSKKSCLNSDQVIIEKVSIVDFLQKISFDHLETWSLLKKDSAQRTLFWSEINCLADKQIYRK